MDITLAIVGLIMGIIGLLGVIIPVLPGTILSYIGLLSVYFISGNSISTLQLVICGIASVVVVVLDYILPGYFSKMFGGTKYGITGATIGTIIGMFFGIIGIILGPFIGAVAGEMVGKKIELSQAIKVGLGSMMAFFAGTGLKLIIGVYILYHIVKEFIYCIF
jgi:uncharacterized protein YqgC (DUF456 family)